MCRRFPPGWQARRAVTTHRRAIPGAAINIASICQRDIVTIEADASPRQAATAMREHHVGALVVTDAAAPSRVAGGVTDRDLAIEALARDLDANSIRVGQLVRRAAVSVPGDGSLREAVAERSAQRGSARRPRGPGLRQCADGRRGCPVA